MCAKILETSGKLNMDEYNFFLRGGVVSWVESISECGVKKSREWTPDPEGKPRIQQVSEGKLAGAGVQQALGGRGEWLASITGGALSPFPVTH